MNNETQEIVTDTVGLTQHSYLTFSLINTFYLLHLCFPFSIYQYIKTENSSSRPGLEALVAFARE